MLNMKKWLDEHFCVQQGMYFNNKNVYLGNTYYSSNYISDSVWNYGVLDELTDESIHSLEILCSKLNKPFNVYIPMRKLDFDDGLLTRLGYKRPYDENNKLITETWMAFDKKKYNLNSYNKVLKVSSLAQRDDFLEVFLAAYGGGRTIEKPYGDLPPQYTEALLKSFDSEKFHHYICYYNEKPVSVASMCYIDGVAGLYNIGTKPEWERRGFGLAVTDACISEWERKGGKKLFLQTETGTGIDDWYERLGFIKLFFGAIYEK